MEEIPLLQLAGTGYLRELLGEEIFSTRPERYFGFIPADKTPVAVELDLVEPFLTFGKFLNRESIHGLDELNSCFGPRASGLGHDSVPASDALPQEAA